MKYYNHLVDIAFSIETPSAKFENIPFGALILALQRRVDIIAKEGNKEAFGDCHDRYELPPTDASRTNRRQPGA